MRHLGSKLRMGWIGSVIGLCVGLAAGGALAAEQKVVRWRFWGGQPELEQNGAIARAFEARHPDIKVELELHATGSYYDKVLVELVSGGAPDIVIVHHLTATTFHKANALMDLNPLLRRDAISFDKADIFPSLLQAMERFGSLTALPMDFTTMQVWFNKTMFDEVGVAYPYDRWSWEQLKHEGRKFVRDINGDGNLDRWALTINRGYEFLTPWISANFGKTVDDVDEPTEILLDSPNTKATIQFLQDLIHVDQVASPPAAGGGHNLFYNAKIAMWPYYFDAHRYQTHVGDTFDWDVAPFFGGFHGPAPHPLMVGGLTIAKNSPNPEAAWTFLKFLASKEGERLRMEHSPIMPTRRSSVPLFLRNEAPPRNKRIYMEILEPGRNGPWERFDNWLEYDKIVNEEFASMWNGQTSVDSAIANAKRRGAALLFGRQ